MLKLNLGILAHVDAGKTSVTERLLHAAGVIDEVGSVDHGTTQTDSLALERRRGITIKSAVVSFVVNDITINLIDTPGHPDFIAEVERVLNVLDAAVLVISAVEGVQSQTRILMRALQRLQIPTLLFVNKIDRTGAGYQRILDNITDRLTPAVIAMGSVRRIGTREADFDLFGPDDEAASANLAEFLAERDEALMASYLDDASLPFPTLQTELTKQTKSASAHPVFFGSAITGAGLDELISGITTFLPSAEEDSGGPLSASVFKVDRGSGGEKIAYARIFSGSVHTRDRVQITGDVEQKVTAIRVFENGNTTQLSQVGAGEIALLWGLADVRIGDVIGAPQTGVERYRLAEPTLETAIVPRNADEKGLLHAALAQLTEQDPLINLRQDDVRQEMYVSLNGEVQKEVIGQTLADDYSVEVEFRETTTICIERPTGTGQAVETLRKAPNPFLATVGFRVEPAPVGSGITFELEVNPESIPVYVYKSVDEFQKAMENTVRETLKQGLNGWEVTDCAVTLTDSGYIPPGSSARDFRLLTPPVLMAALKMAGTVVCEPVHLFRMEGPADMLGPMMSELARLRATPGSTDTLGSSCIVEGEILATQMNELQQRLPGLSRGEGIVEFVFDHFRPVQGDPPSRPRTDQNPLDFIDYLRRISGRV